MPLPILSQSSDSLVRLFFNAQVHWLQHLAESAQTDFGLVLANPDFGDVPAANCVFGADLPAEMSAAQAYDEAHRFFADRSARCLSWDVKPSARGDLGNLLLKKGYRVGENHLLYMVGPVFLEYPAAVTILPARSAYKQTYDILRQQGTELGVESWATAEILHLDDPHTDAFIAISKREPCAFVSMLTSGEIGVVQNLFVATSHRLQGIGTTMMSCILELAGRARLKHIFLPVSESNPGLNELAHLTAFGTIAEWPSYIPAAMT
jgi:GNAT superfamily N-acetyltransferase